jgi:hypothetical protein
MAKGWDGVQQQAAATAEARARAEQTFKPELKVNANSPGPFQIRFLEQGADVNNYPVHEYKIVDGNRTLHKRFTCLSEINQECPGCKAGMKQKRRGVYNVIQRNRPVLRKGTDGKALKNPDGSYVVDGWQDQVVIANVGGPTAEMLRKADGDYRGLMGRDFIVQFSGDTFQAYDLKPVMDEFGNSGMTPLSENDQALMAQKHDLDAYMQPPSPQEAAQIVARYGNNSGASTPQGPPPVGGVGGAQGNAGVAGSASGFLAGAAVPAGGVNAFGAAAGVPPMPPQQPPAPPVQQQPQPIQQPPVMPQPASAVQADPAQVAAADAANREGGTGQPVVPVAPAPPAAPPQGAPPVPAQ